MSPHRGKLLCLWLAAIGLGTLPLLAQSDASSQNHKVTITRLPDRLRIDIDGKLFTEYRFKGLSRPIFYPVLGPKGEPMTRNWPMKSDTPGESHDHPHQKSLWFAHGNINGVDFWSELPRAGHTVHLRFTDIESGGKVGVIRCQNQWVDKDGKVVCTDDRQYRIGVDHGGRFLDYDVTMHADHGPLVFGDTKEGTMGIRLAATLRLHGQVGKGHIINSEGVTGDATWGKRGDWVDYYGPVQGHTVGVAIFDNPKNLRHPTWWHVRGYGLFAANPFGLHYFEHKPAGTGDYRLPAGHDLTFRYRFYFHEGDYRQSQVPERYLEYAEQASNSTPSHP